MSSVFTQIIDGQIPGRFIYADEHCVSFLPIAVLRMGHALVVPRQEVDHWTELDPQLAAHLMQVAQRIGAAQREVFGSARAGLAIQGFEVPHTHLHVWPADSPADFRFEDVDSDPDPQALDQAAADLRAALGTEHLG